MICLLLLYLRTYRGGKEGHHIATGMYYSVAVYLTVQHGVHRMRILAGETRRKRNLLRAKFSIFPFFFPNPTGRKSIRVMLSCVMRCTYYCMS